MNFSNLLKPTRTHLKQVFSANKKQMQSLNPFRVDRAQTINNFWFIDPEGDSDGKR